MDTPRGALRAQMQRDNQMTSQLRIAMDGRSLQGPRTGVGTYTSNLLEQMLSLEPSIRILLAASGDLETAEWAGTERIRVVRIPSLAFNNFLWTNLSLANRLNGYSFDLFHSPGYTLPLRLSAPSAVTIHDISYAANPDWYPHSSGAVRRMWYRRSARRADCIMTPSEFSRREIVRIYGIPPEKIAVIPLGVDRRKFRKIEDPDLLEALRKKYGIVDDCLLFVGDIHRRRNIHRIIEAFGAIKSRRSRGLDLVLIGRILDSSISAREMASLSYGKSIRLLGHIPEEDLIPFYSIAKAFLFPSLYEGFGLGVAEAMACGCPVIIGEGTACEEVAAGAAVLVKPEEAGAIVDAVLGILDNPQLAGKCVHSGLLQSERFSWRKTAEQTMLVYRKLASRGSESTA
jgi:glycosyltransferase involved in cell wall biosynthesis